MKLRRLLLVAAAVPAFSACDGGDGGGGGNDPFHGLYQPTGFTSNPDGCGVEGPAETWDDPYFKLSDESFFGTRILAYYSCTAPGDCDDSILVNKSFEDDLGDSWTMAVKYVSYATYCMIAEEFVTLEGNPDPETAIVITTTFSSTTDGSISESECDPDFDELDAFVDGYRDELVCDRFEVLRADRVPE